MKAMSAFRLRSLVSATLLVGVTAGPLLAQSLAEVAKKEEERRKAITTPARVYTNKDLTGAPAHPPPPATATPAPPADAAKTAEKAKAAEADKGKPAKDQAYWAGRMKELQTQVDRDQTYAEALQTRVNSLNADFVNRDDPAQRAVIERDRQKTVAELNRLKQAVVDGKKAITDLAEEARRAGVPPGWLR